MSALDEMSFYYRLQGRAPVRCSFKEWATAFDGERHVADTYCRGSRISTVFLGLNAAHNLGPPVLFETLVFFGPLANEMRRYSTWQEAEQGHAAMVTAVNVAGPRGYSQAHWRRIRRERVEQQDRRMRQALRGIRE